MEVRALHAGEVDPADQCAPSILHEVPVGLVDARFVNGLFNGGPDSMKGVITLRSRIDAGLEKGAILKLECEQTASILCPQGPQVDHRHSMPNLMAGENLEGGGAAQICAYPTIQSTKAAHSHRSSVPGFQQM